MSKTNRAPPHHQHCPRWRMSADRAPARHVGVAALIANNNLETTERSRRLFPTSVGWCFGHAASFDQNPSCCLSCPRPAEVGFIRLRPDLKCRTRASPSSVASWPVAWHDLGVLLDE